MELTLPVLDDIVRDEAVVLIKPQFEAGRERISKGVVRDKNIHVDVLDGMMNFIRDNTSFTVAGLTHSPIRGPEGNIEFLCYLTHSDTPTNYDIDDIVNNAHEILGR